MAETEAPLWRRVYPLPTPEYRWAMGIRPLDPPRITERTRHFDAEIALKLLIEADPRRTVFAEQDTSLDAQLEAVECITREVGSIEIPNGVPPLLAAARAVQEDIILLQQDDQQEWRLTAGALHFPSGWNVTDKLGLKFLDIHTPVQGFADSDVGKKAAQFLTRLQSGKPVWRSNWTLQAGNSLDTSPENTEDWIPLRNEVTPQNCLDFVQFRIEYQKLFRLPRTGAILFTIHTVMLPLRELAEVRPEADNLLGALKSLDPRIASYKGLTGYLPFVIEALEGNLKGKP